MIPTNESNSKSEEESSFFLKNKIEFKELNKFNLNKYGMGLGVLIWEDNNYLKSFWTKIIIFLLMMKIAMNL